MNCAVVNAAEMVRRGCLIVNEQIMQAFVLASTLVAHRCASASKATQVDTVR